MQYRRSQVPGGTYFFTVVMERRRPVFAAPERVQLLRDAFREVRRNHPFEIDAAVVLPDHLHFIWTLPEGDRDFSTRWRLIKSYFSRRCPLLVGEEVSKARSRKQERAIWQRRFWEHCIRNKLDFENHLNYIHFNPVKHGFVQAPKDWPYSSFRRYVQRGKYAIDWRAK